MGMKPGLTIDELIALYKSSIEALGPDKKPHGGSRPASFNSMRSPSPHPISIKPQGEGFSASDQIMVDRDVPILTGQPQRPSVGGQSLGRCRAATHPGEVLRTEFLLPLGLSQVEFARVSGIPLREVSELARGRRPVSPVLAQKLGEALGTSPQFWLSLQAAWEGVPNSRCGRAPTLSNLKDGIRAHVAKNYVRSHSSAGTAQRPEVMTTGDDPRRNADSGKSKGFAEEISEKVRGVRREQSSSHSKVGEAIWGSIEGNTSLPKDRQARLGIVGLKVYYRIMERWGLSDDEATTLLGLDRHPEATILTIDQLERISHVLGIYKALHSLLNETSANAWILMPNQAPLFSGRPALELLKTGTNGFLDVRTYLLRQVEGIN